MSRKRSSFKKKVAAGVGGLASLKYADRHRSKYKTFKNSSAYYAQAAINARKDARTDGRFLAKRLAQYKESGDSWLRNPENLRQLKYQDAYYSGKNNRQWSRYYAHISRYHNKLAIRSKQKQLAGLGVAAGLAGYGLYHSLKRGKKMSRLSRKGKGSA